MGGYYLYSSPSDEGGPSYPLRQPQQPSLGRSAPYQDPASSSPDFIPPAGQMTHAPSSHFVSSGSFDFGGGLNEGLGGLDTAGLLPNLGSQPLEMTEMELESTPESETFASPREYERYPEAASHGPAGPSGKMSICMVEDLPIIKFAWLCLPSCICRHRIFTGPCHCCI